jgi:hypothetical protein
MFTVSIIGMPSGELLAWMFDHVKKFNGEVTVMDISVGTLEYYKEQDVFQDII